MQREDTVPWYRQFWPWFLILLPGSWVVGSLYTASLAIRTDDSLVVDKGMSVGEATERGLAAERRASELGLSATLDVNLETGLIVTRLESAFAMDTPGTLQLELSHPAFRERDMSVQLLRSMPDADGAATWSGQLPSVPEGRWYLVLQADDWRLNGSWNGQNRVTLHPASETSD